MGLLFLVALLLAWPTYGLSILAWIALSIVRYALKDKTEEKKRASYEQWIAGADRE